MELMLTLGLLASIIAFVHTFAKRVDRHQYLVHRVYTR